MSGSRHTTDDSSPPMLITKESKIGTNLATLLAVIAAVWAVSTYVNNSKRDGVDLTHTVEDHTRQLTNLQVSMGAINDQVRTVTANQAAQTELLRYLARDRKGPVPEAAK